MSDRNLNPPVLPSMTLDELNNYQNTGQLPTEPRAGESQIDLPCDNCGHASSSHFSGYTCQKNKCVCLAFKPVQVELCQRCGQLGGKVISFQVGETLLTSRWVCPHCLDQHERLVTALRDCVESLSRLPDVEGAYRQTCLKQARTALATEQGEGGEL